jgi:hypothetical protein
MQFGHWTAPRNDLIRAIIEDFATRLVPGGILIYTGDTGEKWGHFDAPLLAGLGVNVCCTTRSTIDCCRSSP